MSNVMELMELDKSKNLLHVATGDFDVVKSCMNEFNSRHNSNMIYVDSVDVDGVMFSYIDISNTKVDQIFLFGAFFGVKVRDLREKGEIHW
jgi:hypothetical protein